MIGWRPDQAVQDLVPASARKEPGSEHLLRVMKAQPRRKRCNTNGKAELRLGAVCSGCWINNQNGETRVVKRRTKNEPDSQSQLSR